ncbi:unannotated protein [freshwater metagenome]|uniref:Unannotated protein n=1 Tax=freshwater metagenome TaxID=449393 RepID=A0A6J6SWN5_9ZZZZ
MEQIPVVVALVVITRPATLQVPGVFDVSVGVPKVEVDPDANEIAVVVSPGCGKIISLLAPTYVIVNVYSPELLSRPSFT